MGMLLAIDCSDRACSVALGDQHSLKQQYTDEPRQHAKKLLPMYRALLEECSCQPENIGAVAIAAGPGSFTGLRIGFSFAQGLSFALKVPLITVSSLEALAASYIEAADDRVTDVHSCLDARMGELYVAGFDIKEGLLERQYQDALISVDNFDAAGDYSSSLLLGSGFAVETLADIDAAMTLPEATIKASSVHRIGMKMWQKGQTSSALGTEPLYLRRENAWKTVEQQRASKSMSKGLA